MNIFPFTSTGITQAVWNALVRRLTGFGTALSTGAILNTTLAASATVTFPPAANTNRSSTLGIKAGAAGTSVLSFSDGSNLFLAATVTAGTNGSYTCPCTTNNMFFSLKNNDGANVATYSLIISDWLI